MGRSWWATLELYDTWLRGGVLEVEEMDEYFMEDGDSQGEAGRVTWLLHLVLPPCFCREDTPRIDASRPAADQAAGFTALGWVSPPRTAELMRLMVKYVEGEAAYYGRLGGEGHCDEDLGGGDGYWAIGDDEADDREDIFEATDVALSGEEA